MIVQELIEAVRMGKKDLDKVNTEGFTFGFEFEFIVDPDRTDGEFQEIDEDAAWFDYMNDENNQIKMWFADLDLEKIIDYVQEANAKPIYGYVPQKVLEPDENVTLYQAALKMPQDSEEEQKHKLIALGHLFHPDNKNSVAPKVNNLDYNELTRILAIYLEKAKTIIEHHEEGSLDTIYVNPEKSEYLELDKIKFSNFMKLFGNDKTLQTTLEDAFSEMQVENFGEWLMDNRDTYLLTPEPQDYAKKVFTKENSKFKDWKYTDDESLPGMGVEVISPVIKSYDEAVEILKEVLKIIDKNFDTNNKCGLHINVGKPEWYEDYGNLDLLKLLIIIDEHYILNKFNRKNNEFAEPILKDFAGNFAEINGNIKNKNGFIKFIRTMNDAIIRQAEHTRIMDFGKLKNYGYIELRAVGNYDYQTEFTEVKSILDRFLLALDVASDPNSHKEVYLKKLFNLVNQPDTSNIGTKSKLGLRKGKSNKFISSKEVIKAKKDIYGIINGLTYTTDFNAIPPNELNKALSTLSLVKDSYTLAQLYIRLDDLLTNGNRLISSHLSTNDLITMRNAYKEVYFSEGEHAKSAKDLLRNYRPEDPKYIQRIASFIK